MAAEVTVEALLQQLVEQAEKTALLITQNSEQAAQIKLLIEENARHKKRIEQLERQVKRYVAPHSREMILLGLCGGGVQSDGQWRLT